MKNMAYKNIAVFLFLIIFIILNTGKVKAVLQANGNESATYDLSDWMLNVRRMEESGGAMGLSETLNSDLTSSSESNNIDVHMEKNTEYGALVILSASSYGNPDKVENGQTTTGNATGVVMKLNSERVAVGIDNSRATNFAKAKVRYKNIYSDTYVTKKGDAISETKGWHGSTSSKWMQGVNIKDKYGLLRGFSEGIFSYSGASNVAGTTGAAVDVKLHSRAVVVSGEGL